MIFPYFFPPFFFLIIIRSFAVDDVKHKNSILTGAAFGPFTEACDVCYLPPLSALLIPIRLDECAVQQVHEIQVAT